MSRARIGAAAALVTVPLAGQVALVLWRADATMLNGDTSQLLSSGLNLLSGNGYATDAVHFANQFAHVPLPAPQTIWPPGLAVLLGLLVAAGMPPYAAALALSLTGFALVVVLTGAIAVALRLSACRAALAAGGVAATSLFGVLAVRGFADALFVAATLASALLLVRATTSGRATRLIAWAGGFAALAFSVRYAAVAWIVAGAIGLLAPHGLRDARRALRDVAVFGLLPAAAVLAAFGRNLALTGTLTGAPVLGGDEGVVEVARQLYWGVLRLLGAFDNVGEVLVETLALVVALRLGWRLLARSRRSALGPTGPNDAERRFRVLALAYAAATLALLTQQSLTAYSGFVQPRYLVPLLPFGLLLAVLAVARSDGPSDGAPLRARAAQSLVALLAGVAFVAGQLTAGAASLAAREGKEQAELASRLSTARVGDARVLDLLVRTASREHPLTGGDVQFLTGLHGIPTVSLPGFPYADRTWDEAAVRASMARSGSCLLLLYAGRPERYERERLPFFADLVSGRSVSWLTRHHTGDGISLYRPSWCPSGPIDTDRPRGAHAMSNRSAFITFVQAATKSRTNFSRLSSCA